MARLAVDRHGSPRGFEDPLAYELGKARSAAAFIPVQSLTARSAP
ncbi:hypothetical protein ACWD25_05670 [Streptomyces sp. NPDC002920]